MSDEEFCAVCQQALDEHFLTILNGVAVAGSYWADGETHICIVERDPIACISATMVDDEFTVTPIDGPLTRERADAAARRDRAH